MAEKINVDCTLRMDKIVYDVQVKTYLTGAAREAAGMGYREAAQIKAADDDEQAFEVYQAITNAVGQLQVELGEYLEDVCTAADDEILPAVLNREGVVFRFKMPSNYNTSATKGLTNAMSEYVTNTAVSRWYLMTDKADVAEYVALAAEALERAKQALYKRRRPVRETSETTSSGGPVLKY